MTHPVIMALEHAGQWLTQAELAQRLSADYPSEDYIASDIVAHLNRGDLQSRIRYLALPPADFPVWEFGLPDWDINEPNPVDPAEQLARIQRITSADWSRPLTPAKDYA